MTTRIIVLIFTIALSALLLTPLGATLLDRAFQLSVSDSSQDEGSPPQAFNW